MKNVRHVSRIKRGRVWSLDIVISISERGWACQLLEMRCHRLARLVEVGASCVTGGITWLLYLRGLKSAAVRVHIPRGTKLSTWVLLWGRLIRGYTCLLISPQSGVHKSSEFDAIKKLGCRLLRL